MRDIIETLREWLAADKEIALATIVETRGSSLRAAGTRMALTAEGDVAGSVSSGCVDSDAVAEMNMVLHKDALIRRPFFGVSDEEAWGAGLSCGGAIDVLVERWSPIYETFISEIEARRPVGFATRTDTPVHLLRTASGEIHGALGDPALDKAVLADMVELWPGPHAKKHIYPQGEVFVEVAPPPPTLLIFGATDIAIPLAEMANVLDFQVVVSDARRAFLREERFPHAHIALGWPQDLFTPEDLGPGWAVVVLFHNPKFDLPALTLALESDAFYIGFLGSRKTQAERRAQLQEAGFTEEDLARIHGPVGLNIGGRAPAMIALSILSEVAAVRHRRPGGMLGA